MLRVARSHVRGQRSRFVRSACGWARNDRRANTAHVFSVPHNLELMRKMRAGVQPGARLLLVDLWTDPSHTQPGPAALISGEFLIISGEGQAYSEQEADTWLDRPDGRRLKRRHWRPDQSDRCRSGLTRKCLAKNSYLPMPRRLRLWRRRKGGQCAVRLHHRHGERLNLS